MRALLLLEVQDLTHEATLDLIIVRHVLERGLDQWRHGIVLARHEAKVSQMERGGHRRDA